MWCSNTLTMFDEDIVQGCDFRAASGPAAYFTVCADTDICNCFKDFKRYAKDFRPKLDRDTLTLTTAKGHSVGGNFILKSDPIKTHFNP